MPRILGIDPGDARIGVAVSDTLGMLAHPVETIHISKIEPVGRIRELAGRYAVSSVVVGVPRNMDGSRGPAAQKSLDLIEKLREALTCPVVPWDERLSTVQAERNLRAAGRKARDQKTVVDQAAAQVILQSYLDSRG